MKPLCALLAAALCASCAPRAAVRAVAGPAPVTSSPVAPAASKVYADARQGGEIAARLEGRVAGVRDNAEGLRVSVFAARAEADRLRKQQAASSAELEKMWLLLTDAEGNATRLFAEAKAAQQAADEQRAHREQAQRNLSDLQAAAAARDSETENLRAQRTDLADRLTASIAAAADAEKKVAAATFQAVMWRKTTLWTGASLATLILVIAAIVGIRLWRAFASPI